LFPDTLLPKRNQPFVVKGFFLDKWSGDGRISDDIQDIVRYMPISEHREETLSYMEVQ